MLAPQVTLPWLTLAWRVSHRLLLLELYSLDRSGRTWMDLHSISRCFSCASFALGIWIRKWASACHCFSEVDGSRSAAKDLARSNPICIPLCCLACLAFAGFLHRRWYSDNALILTILNILTWQRDAPNILKPVLPWVKACRQFARTLEARSLVFSDDFNPQMYIFTVHAWVQISDWHFEAKVQCVSSSQHILVASNFVWHECSPLKCRCSIFKASWCWLSSCHDCIMGGGSREWAQVLSDSRKICKCSSFMKASCCIVIVIVLLVFILVQSSCQFHGSGAIMAVDAATWKISDVFLWKHWALATPEFAVVIKKASRIEAKTCLKMSLPATLSRQTPSESSVHPPDAAYCSVLELLSRDFAPPRVCKEDQEIRY